MWVGCCPLLLHPFSTLYARLSTRNPSTTELLVTCRIVDVHPMCSKHPSSPSCCVSEAPTLTASCTKNPVEWATTWAAFPTATTPIHQLQPQRSGRHASVNHVDAIRHRFSSTAKRCRYAGNAMNELEHSLPESTYSRHPDLATRISPIQAIRHDPMANVAYK